jgi:hypothetical protein
MELMVISSNKIQEGYLDSDDFHTNSLLFSLLKFTFSGN